jgi:hypothetical protein
MNNLAPLGRKQEQILPLLAHGKGLREFRWYKVTSTVSRFTPYLILGQNSI